MTRKFAAEFIGTFWLVFGGCGSAVIAAGFPEVGIGLLGVALAFGLTVLTMAFALGGVSGGHFNPAVTLGLALAGRFEMRQLPVYWVAQVAGAAVAATVLFAIVSDQAGFAGVGGFATNGYGEASPGGYGMIAVLLIEVVLTAAFLIVILGATSPAAPAGFAPIAIGLALTVIHLVSIPVTNTSVNPARSTGVALFAEGPALAQLWLFWLAPLVGGVAGALIWRTLFDASHQTATPAASARPVVAPCLAALSIALPATAIPSAWMPRSTSSTALQPPKGQRREDERRSEAEMGVVGHFGLEQIGRLNALHGVAHGVDEPAACRGLWKENVSLL